MLGENEDQDVGENKGEVVGSPNRHYRTIFTFGSSAKRLPEQTKSGVH
jgi:hypothetical protein